VLHFARAEKVEVAAKIGLGDVIEKEFPVAARGHRVLRGVGFLASRVEAARDLLVGNEQ
jgi:hypothetical protein